MDVESLVRTLRAHDASFDAAAVRAAFSDSASISTDLGQWATVHLTPDTLLSVDELNQYAALEEAGLAERLAMSSDLTTARVLSDQEIKDAIDELNRSTNAITRHTEILRQQQDALHRLLDVDRQSAGQRGAIDAGRARKWEAQRRGLAAAANDLSQSLSSRVLELEQQSTGASATIQQTMDTLFHSDDKLLSSLQKLGLELETEDAEEQRDVVMLRETCARLIKFTVEGVRTRLDRTYLESLKSSSRAESTNHVPADEVAALQEELESLYAEILPVAQIATEQQFLAPALRSLAAKKGQGLARTAKATSYIHDCLDYLIDRAQDLTARLEAFQAYQIAANAVFGIAKFELAAQDEGSTTPTKTARQQEAISPVRPQPKQRLTYSIGAVGDEPPLEEILRTLAINLPEEEISPDAQTQAKELAATLASRQAKTHDVARNVQEMLESTATKQVSDGKLAIQLVRDSILAESPFGEVRLVDPELEGSIAVLSQELANVEEKLNQVNSNAARLRGRNAKRDELVSRWGS
ncbi:hypothetical protein N0V88_001523 [Collariella sp. IMI 366227]|nr:hypothetical protein N0V88_001523 [Collariella sp. IMI 366227]